MAFKLIPVKANPKRRTKATRRKKRRASVRRKRRTIRARKNPGGMFLEYDWTFNVYRARFGNHFTDVRGERSWDSLPEAKRALRAANLKLGKKTDSRTWRIETASNVIPFPKKRRTIRARRNVRQHLTGKDYLIWGKLANKKTVYFNSEFRKFSHQSRNATRFTKRSAEIEAHKIVNRLPASITAIGVSSA